MSNRKGSILFFGQSYYNTWFLSRELRKLGWRADTLLWEEDPGNLIFYHGTDYQFIYKGFKGFFQLFYRIFFYFRIFFRYDVIHFSNRGCIGYFWEFYWLFGKLRLKRFLPKLLDVKLFKLFGFKITYSNNGCNDGVLQSTWGNFNPSPCNICTYKLNSFFNICSDNTNKRWGTIRNKIADAQFTLGGYLYDFNDDPEVYESPWFYCLDKNFWNPELLIPANYKLPYDKEKLLIYHSVGNFETRSNSENKVNIKCTHIYVPLIEQLKKEGYNAELIFFNDVPNKKLRYYQMQSHILVDMLTFGFFGANVREAMMLGIPCICYLRPEFLEKMKSQIPDYVAELPVISATPESIHDVLLDLIINKEKRVEIGKRSREFAVKWHSSENAALHFDKFYSDLIANKK